ncbi:MAG: nitroreductase [Roseobacter sp.]
MTEFETLNALLDDRYSCRAFLPDAVPQKDIKQIIETAQKVPSWCNAQPWHVIVTQGTQTEQFKAALQAETKTGAPKLDLEGPQEYVGVYGTRRREVGWQLYDAVGVTTGDRAASAIQMMRNFALFDAPHVAILTSPTALRGYGAMDSGGFVLAFTLAARALGIDTIAQAAIANYASFVRDYFDIPQDRMVLCGISFGYADHDHPANRFRTSRAPLGEIVEWKS